MSVGSSGSGLFLILPIGSDTNKVVRPVIRVAIEQAGDLVLSIAEEVIRQSGEFGQFKLTMLDGLLTDEACRGYTTSPQIRQLMQLPPQQQYAN